MRLEPIEAWIEELKKRGIKTFESKDLPIELRDRTMIIKAKYAGVIRKTRRAIKKSKGETTNMVWEII